MVAAALVTMPLLLVTMKSTHLQAMHLLLQTTEPVMVLRNLIPRLSHIQVTISLQYKMIIRRVGMVMPQLETTLLQRQRMMTEGIQILVVMTHRVTGVTTLTTSLRMEAAQLAMGRTEIMEIKHSGATKIFI